jgi:hypothetical protein
MNAEKDLELIKNWQPKSREDFDSLITFCKDLWTYDSWGDVDEDGIFSVSTYGWSGNEEIIGALEQNYLFWAIFWLESRRGGHFKFKLPPSWS